MLVMRPAQMADLADVQRLAAESPVGVTSLPANREALLHKIQASQDALAAEVRLYDRLFTDAQPDAGGKDYLALLNPDSLKVVTAWVEPSLAGAQPDDKFQFERFGYFVADRHDHSAARPVFNRITGLKDSWGK